MGAQWYWEGYDTFMRSLVSVFLCDEFITKNLTQEVMSLKTNYSYLKDLRGDIKLNSMAFIDKLFCDCKSNVHSNKANAPQFKAKHKPSCMYHNYPVWI
jgi:hypothetical protein